MTSPTPENSPSFVDVIEATTAVVRGETIPMTELPPFFDHAFSRLPAVIAAQGATILAPAFARYLREPTDTADLEVGFVIDRAIEPDGEVVPAHLPAGRVARVVHAGSFEGLGQAWGALGAWIAEQGSSPTSCMWESYLTEPSPDMDPADLRTELNWQIQG